MKKSFIILLTFFYLIVVSGLTVRMHYCGGKLKQISFLQNDNEKGCCGNKKRSKGCCKNKTTFLKVKDNHEANALLNAPTPTKLILDITPIVLDYYVYLSNVCDVVIYYHEPPVFYDNPLYLKHRVLLI